MHVRFESDLYWSVFEVFVHSGSDSSVKIVSKGPAHLQQLAGAFGERLHGCMAPCTQGLSPKLLFAQHVCIH